MLVVEDDTSRTRASKTLGNNISSARRAGIGVNSGLFSQSVRSASDTLKSMPAIPTREHRGGGLNLETND